MLNQRFWQPALIWLLLSMKVGEIMEKDVIAIKKGTLYQRVAEILIKNRISGAPVIDDNGKIVGVVSEKDLFKAVYPDYKDFYETPEAYLDFEKLEEEAKKSKIKKLKILCQKD